MTLDRGRGSGMDGMDGMDREHEAFADWDAAYVLGALTPADRRAFEDHLAGCELCRVAVGELAPLPGLLARASRPAEGGEADAADGERTPDEPGAAEPRAALVDLVVRREARGRVRRRLLVGGIAAVLVAGIAVGVPLVVHDHEGPAETVALARQVDTPLTATVDLTPAAWGTRLSMDCDYPASASGYPRVPGADAAAPVYALVVTDVDGTQSQVSTWSAEPGRDVRLDAATAVPLDRIASVEVRSATGTTLLSARLTSG